MKIKILTQLLILLLISLPTFAKEVASVEEAFSNETFQNFLDKNEATKARDYLISKSSSNNFEAQVTLARIYLGEQKLSEDINSFSCDNYNDTSRFVELGMKLAIKPDIKKAVEILDPAVKTKNPEAGIILAIMLHDGIGINKDRIRAKDILISFQNFAPARFYFELYFGEIKENNLKDIDCSRIISNKIISSKNSPYTFIPEKSSTWKNTSEEISESTNEKVRFIKEYSRSASKDKKILIPITVIKELNGWISDSGDAIFLVDPSQGNKFFVENKVYVDKLGAWISNEGYFGYHYIGELSNGIQIINCIENGGGSLTISCYYFFGFEDVRSLSGNGIRKFTGIRNYGYVWGESKGGYYKSMIVDNVFAAYHIMSSQDWQNETFTTSISFVSFECDKNKFLRSKEKILKELLKHRM